MQHHIRTAAVLGAGIMGSQIAAHLANGGIRSYLLDVVPTSLTPEEQRQGRRLDHPQVRNRLALNGLRQAREARPAAFYASDLSALVTPGNMQDHLHWLGKVDWVIEAVTEQADVKAQVYQAIAPYLQPSAILTSNTSGLSLSALSETLPAGLRRRFLGTHFFNPPRYLKLMEIVPWEGTDPDVLHDVRRITSRVLDREVVIAKDVPGFITNRLGCYVFLVTMDAMDEFGFEPDEVDAITGPVMGRPKSATIGTARRWR